MEIIEVKQITKEEILQLQKIGRQTFYETFSETNTEENIKNYLENSFSIDKINDELDNKNSEFYFAKIADEVIGYLKLNYGQSQTELKDNKALEI